MRRHVDHKHAGLSGAGLLTLFAVILAPADSSAMGKEACEPLSFIASGDGRIVSYHEFGPDGPGPGDVRPGVRPVTDAGGTAIGELRWYETLIGPDGDPDGGTVSVVRYYVVLADGTLLGEYLNRSRQTRPDVTRPPIGDDEVIILGGTGVYAGARGVMRQTVGTDTDPLSVLYDVEFVC